MDVPEKIKEPEQSSEKSNEQETSQKQNKEEEMVLSR